MWNETITNDLPTNPVSASNGANDDAEDDDEDDGDEDNMPSSYIAREPRTDAVKSTASSFFATAFVGKDAMRLKLVLTFACMVVTSKLLLN